MDGNVFYFIPSILFLLFKASSDVCVSVVNIGHIKKM